MPTDRQAADAVRGRIDPKYALGLELTDPGLPGRGAARQTTLPEPVIRQRNGPNSPSETTSYWSSPCPISVLSRFTICC